MTTHKVVPREPTPEMLARGLIVAGEDLDPTIDEVTFMWRAMYDAAPDSAQRARSADSHDDAETESAAGQTSGDGVTPRRDGESAAPAVQDAPPPRDGSTGRCYIVPVKDDAEELRLERTLRRDGFYFLVRNAAPAVADAPRTAATPGDPANVIRPEDGGLSEYTATQEDAPLPPRKAFERWAVSRPAPSNVKRLPEGSRCPGKYEDDAIEVAWEAWQAARLVRPPEGTDGVLIALLRQRGEHEAADALKDAAAALAEKDAEIARYRRALDSIANESQPWRAAVDRDLIFRTAAVALGPVFGEKGSTHADD